jgi:hypothetical protein
LVWARAPWMPDTAIDRGRRSIDEIDRLIGVDRFSRWAIGKLVAPMLVGEDVVYKQVLTNPRSFSNLRGSQRRHQSFHRRGMKQD